MSALPQFGERRRAAIERLIRVAVASMAPAATAFAGMPDLGPPVPAPCPRRRRACSACIRFEQAWRNRRDHDSSDDLGGPVAPR